MANTKQDWTARGAQGPFRQSASKKSVFGLESRGESAYNLDASTRGNEESAGLGCYEAKNRGRDAETAFILF